MPIHASRSLWTSAAAGFDAATLAWVAAVFAVDGTVVSAPQKTLVDNLIVGLKADGLFTKLDRLWLFAIENQTEALVDVIADQLAASVNATMFTPNTGFTGDAATQYLNSGFNPTANGVAWSQNSASFGAWAVIGNANTQALMGATSPATQIVQLTNQTCAVNEDAVDVDSGTAVTAGFWAASRTASNAQAFYKNGSSVATDATASSGNINFQMYILGRNNSGVVDRRSSAQLAAAFMGGGLNPTDAANLYSRLRTYMTAVGVP